MTVGWKSTSYPAKLSAQVCYDHHEVTALGANLIIGEVKMIRGQGMPSMRHHDFGNLYIQFDVKFPPKAFNSQQKLEMLESILPARTRVFTTRLDGLTSYCDGISVKCDCIAASY